MYSVFRSGILTRRRIYDPAEKKWSAREQFVHVRGRFQYEIVELYDTAQVLYQAPYLSTVETNVTRLL